MVKSYILDDHKLGSMTKYFILLGCLWFGIGFNSIAQSKSKNGDDYYKMKTYGKAIQRYERELRKDKDNPKIMFKIVDCYLKSNLDRTLALPYAKKLVDSDASTINVLNYGKALFYAADYALALEQLEEVKKKTEQGDELHHEAVLFSSWLMNAQAYESKPVNVDFINLGKKVNTAKNEINPMVSADDRLLMFSNNKRYVSYVGVYYYNVCVTHNEALEWQKHKTIGSAVNSGYDEIVCGLTPDGKKLFVYHNRDWLEQIGFAYYKGNYKFSRLAPFDEGWKRKTGTFGVWQTDNLDTLLFVGENEEGNTDIYYKLEMPDGTLGHTRPVPGKINSSAEENFPVLTPDGRRLYFSSNRKESMGGYDLFCSDWDEEKKEWGEPVNLGYPINDKYDNYTISFVNGLRYAYVAAVRPEGYGEKDIYKLVFNDQKPGNYIMKCFVRLQTDTGNVVPPFRLRAELTDSVGGSVVGTYAVSSDSSKFVMALEPGKYMVSFYKRDSLMCSTPISIPELLFDNAPVCREFIIPKELKEEE